MASPIDNLVRSASSSKSLNILVYVFDGYFEYCLAQAFPQHHFYCLKNTAKIKWNTNVWQPSNNLHLSVEPPSHIVFDCILSNDFTSHYKSAYTASQMFHIPLILMEHIPTDKPPNTIKTKHHYISHELVDVSSEGLPIFPYGVGKLNNTLDKSGVVVISDFTPRDIMVVQDMIRQSSLPIKIFGNNPGLSKPIDNLYMYKKTLEEGLIYLHLTSDVNIPVSVLHAMSAGCIVISTKTPLLENVITKDRGFLVNSGPDMLSIISKVKNNPDKYVSCGKNAQNYTQDNFNMKTFTENWSGVFNKIEKEVVIR